MTSILSDYQQQVDRYVVNANKDQASHSIRFADYLATMSNDGSMEQLTESLTLNENLATQNSLFAKKMRSELATSSVSSSYFNGSDYIDS